jgi:DNA repair protein RecO (recombination protein O)
VTILATEGIVLSAMRYGETSKIVRLATREYGVQSAIARGAMRPRSRFGAALQVLSRGQVQLLPARSSDLHTLTAFDLIHLPLGLGARIERYTAAEAMAEVVVRFAPADAHPALYDAFRDGLDRLETAAPETAGAVALRALWRLVGLLGFAPATDACVLDGLPLPVEGPLPFSVREGGALCAACARTHAVSVLPPEDRVALTALCAPEGPLPELDPRREAAHRRLLSRFIHQQVAEGAELPALDVWQRRAWELA